MHTVKKCALFETLFLHKFEQKVLTNPRCSHWELASQIRQFWMSFFVSCHTWIKHVYRASFFLQYQANAYRNRLNYKWKKKTKINYYFHNSHYLYLLYSWFFIYYSKYVAKRILFGAVIQNIFFLVLICIWFLNYFWVLINCTFKFKT